MPESQLRPMVVLSAIRGGDFQQQSVEENKLAKVHHYTMYTVKFVYLYSKVFSPLYHQTGHTYGFMGLWSGKYCMVG